MSDKPIAEWLYQYRHPAVVRAVRAKIDDLLGTLSEGQREVFSSLGLPGLKEIPVPETSVERVAALAYEWPIKFPVMSVVVTEAIRAQHEKDQALDRRPPSAPG